MTAKYDFPRLHADCLSWCQNPSFPYRWQPTYEYHCEKRSFAYVIQSNTMDSDFATCFLQLGDYPDMVRLFEFAHFIGINIEDYRIKETYKSAVERYLSTIGEGQQLWEGSPVYSQTLLR